MKTRPTTPQEIVAKNQSPNPVNNLQTPHHLIMKTPNQPLHRHTVIPTLAALIFVAAATAIPAQAAVRNFSVSSGNFNTPGSWSPAAVPVAGDTVFIGNITPGTNQVVDLDASTNTAFTCYVGLNAGAKGFLNVSNVGNLTVTGLYLGVNGNATGTVNQTGGVVNVLGELRINDGSTGSGTYNLSNGTLNVSSGVDMKVGYSGSGVGTFALSGTGALTASSMTIGAGSSLTDSGGTLSVTSITNNGTIAFSNAGVISRNSTISGTGVVTKSGAGQLILSGNNTYSGGTTINDGSIGVDHMNVFGSGNLTINKGALVMSTSGTFSKAFTLAGSGDSHNILRATASSVFTGNITSTAPSNSTFNVYSTVVNGNTTFQNNSISLGSEKMYVWKVGTTGKPDSDANVTNFDNVQLSTTNSFDVAGAKVRVLAGTTMNIGGNLTSPGNFSQFEMNGGNVAITGGIDFAPGSVAASGLAFNGGTLTTSYIYGAEFGSGANKLDTTFNGTTVVAAAESSDFLRVRLDGNTTNLYGTSAKLGNGGLILNTAGYNATISNSLADASGATGILTKQGNGTLTLNASNTYSGATSITAGRIQLTNGSGLGSTAAGTTVASGAQLLLNNVTVGNEALTISGTGLASGSSTAGAVRSLGNNTYQGKVTLAANATIFSGSGTSLTLDVASGDAVDLSNSTLTIDGAGTNRINDAIVGTGGITKVGSGTLTLSGNNNYSGATVIGLGTLQLGDGGTSGSLSSSSAITNNGTLAINRSDEMTISNNISGTGSFTKSGAGKLILSGTNTYTGLTTVSAGTLAVNGSVAGAMSVVSGATLQGSGTIGGNTTVSGNLNPGNSPGLLTFANSLTLDSTSATTTMEITGIGERGVAYDAVNVTNALTYGGTLILDFSGVLYTEGVYSFDLFDFGPSNPSSSFSSMSLAGIYGGSFTDNEGIWDLTDGDNNWSFNQADGILTFTVVPEPNVAMVAGSLALMAMLRRRRD